MPPRRGIAGLLAALVLATAVLAASADPPTGSAMRGATPEPLLFTGQGSALRVGPGSAEHLVGLLASGGGAIGMVIADDGSFLAFTCGMRPQVKAWFSGDWYQGRMEGNRPAEAAGPDGERLVLARDAEGHVRGRLVAAVGTSPNSVLAAPGPFGINYGSMVPVGVIVLHVVFGAVVGGVYDAA